MDFLQTISQGTTLISILQQSKQIKNKIFKFLSTQDQINMIITCKTISSMHHFKQQNDDIQTWKTNLLKFSKKQKDHKIIETPHNIIVKLRYFTVPIKYLDKRNWKMIDPSDKALQQKLKEDKFLKATENVFFKNLQSDEIMFMNRSLIDPKLNYTYWKEGETIEEHKYDILYEEDANHYDFSNMKSMLQRQKDIMQKFQDRELKKSQDALPENCLEQLTQLKKITMILCCGGYFSMAVYLNGKCTIHQSDHKYVCRKKAGGRQMKQDKGGGQGSSIGSQIRRDQEIHHQDNVKQILTDNFKELESSDVIFLQAPGMNKLFLVQDVEPLGKMKDKLRSMCISSKKAKYTEIERIYKAITKIYLIFDKKK